MTRQTMIDDLFHRLLAATGRVYPEELNRLLAEAGHAPASREEMDRAAGLATDPAGRVRQAEVLRELRHACDAAGLRGDDRIDVVLERLGLVPKRGR